MVKDGKSKSMEKLGSEFRQDQEHQTFSSNPLGPFGFKLEHASADKVSGRFQVTPKCCQPIGTLHGGVSALIAEDLGSMGVYLASGRRKVTGIEVCISHLKRAQVGDIVQAEATPLNPGTTIQAWEVRFWKIDSTSSGNKSLLASSSVTVLCNMSGNAKDGQNNVKQAKL
ncbi:1,4-dihydroxy-2-naphthoyl-CoA thioesterase 1-like [Coffea arabica]|uniref:1,4-dihydroxy-2-naphthoyl-CoA thioesterase 1-like n=1 Tax=Coffea arabica TaxID=13443 RepID=A0ABM4U0V6_COFAR